jgi:hypothetical protein
MIAIDTHVHVYESFPLGPFLDRALATVKHYTENTGEPPQTALCLTEARDGHCFRDWKNRTGQSLAATWRVASVPEPYAIWLERQSGERLLVVAGRQTVSHERIEVLCLGSDLVIPDGTHDLDELIHIIREAEGLPVMPWGFGKWTGARGRRLQRLLDETKPDDLLFLGDSANRPVGWPRPRAFAWAQRNGRPILPGSDPLPLAAGRFAVGRYGLLLSGTLSPDRPWSDARRSLLHPQDSDRVYGRRMSFPAFLLTQTQLRLARRRAGIPRKSGPAI